MKLILVEGQPGSGKTGISEFLYENLKVKGEKCFLLDEDEQENIVGDVWQDYTEESITNIDTLKNKWKSFVDANINNDACYIMDNFLMNHVQYFMAVQSEKETIAFFVKYINLLVKNVTAEMIFLDGDSEKIIKRINDIRKNGWGLRVSELLSEYPYQKSNNRKGIDGMVEFFKDSQRLKREMLKLWEHPILTIDVTKADWEEYRQKAADFILK